MVKRILVTFLALLLFAIPTCATTSPYPHYGPRVALADSPEVLGGPEIVVDDVNYIPGRNNSAEDETEVTISGYSWNYCERIYIYVNGMRHSVFDPKTGDWTVTVEFAAIRDEVSIQAEGTMSGWSNKVYIDGAVQGPKLATIQSDTDAGTVGSEVAIMARDWFPPRGVITISFGTIVVDRIYPSDIWQSIFTVPERPAGIWQVTVRDESVMKSFDFEIVPSLTIEPANPEQGQLITIIGRGFAANHYVHVTLLPPIDRLVFADMAGSFRLEGLPAPASTFLINALDEMDNEVNLSVGTDVLTTPSATNQPTSQGQSTVVDIPTSSNSLLIIGAIVALVILGLVIGMIILARRRVR